MCCSGLGFPAGLSHHLPHIKQEFDRPPGLISQHGEDKHDSPKKKVSQGADPLPPFPYAEEIIGTGKLPPSSPAIQPNHIKFRTCSALAPM
jgi:hypothetical protein